MQNKTSKKRQKLIADLEKEKTKRIKRAQKRLASIVLTYMADNLITEEGVIKNTVANYEYIAGLDVLQRQFELTEMGPILRWFVKSFNKILKQNNNYFKSSPEAKTNKVNSIIKSRIGISSNGKIKKGGYLSTIKNTTKVFSAIKGVAVRGVANRLPQREYSKEIQEFIIPTKKKGLLETELYEKTQDVFNIIDRETGNNYAAELGLNFAIYQGGIIKTSRPFCLERNNKVYSKEEIQDWASLDFEGKSDPYNPFTDCGGYNCRHQLDWISDELAFRLRPDLKQLLNEG